MHRRATNGHRIVDDFEIALSKGYDGDRVGPALVEAYYLRGSGERNDEVSTIVDMLTDVGHHCRRTAGSFEPLLQGALDEKATERSVQVLRTLLLHARTNGHPVPDIATAVRNIVRNDLGPEGHGPGFPTAL